jgi:hypothetical protein
MSQPNQHVQQHLRKNGVNPNELPDSVIDALNSCSPEELNAMDKVGASLQDASVEPNLSVKSVH